MNQYTGFSLPAPTVSRKKGSATTGSTTCDGTTGKHDNENETRSNTLTNITPLMLWNECISQRKPCVIDTLPVTNVHETVVHLKAGQSLYLPAGWFYEVTSESTKSHYHMALNYWFHPPDKLDDYDCPYTDKERFANTT